MTRPSAQTAIKILNNLKSKTSTENLAYFVTPNTILTLSGARAYCDGIFYNKNDEKLKNWHKEISETIDILKTITGVFLSECKVGKTIAKENMVSYELVFKDGLKQVLANTNLINEDMPELFIQNFNTSQLLPQLEVKLKQNKDLVRFNNEDIGHIAFGILLGYPDKAILSSVDKWSDDNPFTETLIDANILGCRYYFCPQPVYSYARNLVDDTEINKHEKLWSSILKDYYLSDFHKNLEQNSNFKHKLTQLGMK